VSCFSEANNQSGWEYGCVFILVLRVLEHHIYTHQP